MVNPTKSIVDEEILTARFACDVRMCHGACCTLPGGRGAPLDDPEVAELERAFPAVRKHLTARSLAVIASDGMVEGTSGHFHTTCIDDKDCVFVLYEEGIARCAVEKAFLAGEIGWRKPLSCHLFPVRVAKDGSRVQYERIGECLPGLDRGMREEISLVDFLREPLTRRFGGAWYEEFRRECGLSAGQDEERTTSKRTGDRA
jgi:hypothetical protein